MDFWQTMRGEKLISTLTRNIPKLITKQYVVEVDKNTIAATIIEEIENGNHYVDKFENEQTNKTVIIFEKSIY